MTHRISPSYDAQNPHRTEEKKANGNIRINEPLPFLCTPVPPHEIAGISPYLARNIAKRVVDPMSKTYPFAEYFPLSNHSMNFFAISSGSYPRTSESIVATVSDVSSDHVPGTCQ